MLESETGGTEGAPEGYHPSEPRGINPLGSTRPSLCQNEDDEHI